MPPRLEGDVNFVTGVVSPEMEGRVEAPRGEALDQLRDDERFDNGAA